MKKILSIILIFSFSFCFTACHMKPILLSNDTYHTGSRAIETIDEYLDGELIAEDAIMVLSELNIRLIADKPYAGDFKEISKQDRINLVTLAIKATLNDLIAILQNFQPDINSSDKSELIEARNSLARLLNQKELKSKRSDTT